MPVLDSFALPECELVSLSSCFSHKIVSSSNLMKLHSDTEVIEVLMKEQNLIFRTFDMDKDVYEVQKTL